jgi:hypothetical protein
VGFPGSDDPWSAVRAGYEVQIDPEDAAGNTTGAVYDAKGPDTAARDGALNTGDGAWNTMEVLVEGQRIRVYVNGVQVNDFTNTDPGRGLGRGHVGLQNHGDGDTVAFRNVRIKELAPPATDFGEPGPTEPVLLSAGRPVEATSVEGPAYGPGNAVDGDRGTRWSSLFADPQSITVDLGSTRSVSRVRLDWEVAFGRAYAVRTSTDGSSWTTVSSTTASDGGVDDLTFDALSARYVQVLGTERGTPWGYSLWELEVYGT